MSGEEANLSSARKIPDSLKCPAGGGWKFKTLSRQEEQPDPAQAGFPVPRWALHTDLTWQGIKYLKLQKVVVVQELLFPPGEAQSVQWCWTSSPCSSLPTALPRVWQASKHRGMGEGRKDSQRARFSFAKACFS